MGFRSMAVLMAIACYLCSIATPGLARVQTATAMVAGGAFQSSALLPDGTIVTWGNNCASECAVPPPNANFVSMAVGGYHTLGLKSDGTIVAWGDNFYGQCDVPAPNADFVAVAAGGSYSLGLKSDGTIVAWGSNALGQLNVPSPNAGFVAVTAGTAHSLGLKSNGTIVAWGSNAHGELDVPSPNAGFVAVTAGLAHSLGLKSDGSIVAWGWNISGQCNVPAPNSGFTRMAAGWYHSMALRNDGTIAAWGDNFYGECEVPSPNADFMAIGAGGDHSLGLKSDGTVRAWGGNAQGECNVPLRLGGGCPRNWFYGYGFGHSSYDPATGTLDVDAYPDGSCFGNDGAYQASIWDDFMIVNLPTGMPVTFTGHMDWTVDAGGCLDGATYSSPTFPAQVLVGEPFRLAFSATAVAAFDCETQICYGATIHGHLWFSDLPPGAVVTSCQGFVQQVDPSAVEETSVGATALAIERLTPNPASGPFDVSITLANDSPASLDVFDVRGRLVARIPVKGLTRGKHTVGVPAQSHGSSGIYFVRLTQGSQTVWAKQAIVR